MDHTLLEGTPLDYRHRRGRRWQIETDVLEKLFETGNWFKNRVAPLLLASTASDATKSKALRVLSGAVLCERQVLLRAHICVPAFLSHRQRNELVTFSVHITIPQFLIGLPVTISVTITNNAEGEEIAIQTDPKEYVLERHMKIEAEGACRLVGEFHWLRLHVILKNASLICPFPLPIPLQVHLSRSPMFFDLQMPCLLAVGATQAAIFVVDHADPMLTALSLVFAMLGLREIRYAGSVFREGEKVTIEKIRRRMELFLLYEVVAADDTALKVVISMTRADCCETVQKTELFQLPPTGRLAITLVNESDRFQQFLVTNSFPATFSFVCDGRKHRIRPNSKHHFIRAGSGALSLAVVEDGWEEFPVLVKVDSFDPQIPIVELDFGAREWTSGDARLVRVGGAASALPDANWIAVQHRTPGDLWVLIPKRPGVLRLPDFLIGQQICRTVPPTVRILACECPPLIPI
jgi:hypothetical protein